MWVALYSDINASRTPTTATIQKAITIALCHNNEKGGHFFWYEWCMVHIVITFKSLIICHDLHDTLRMIVFQIWQGKCWINFVEICGDRSHLYFWKWHYIVVLILRNLIRFYVFARISSKNWLIKIAVYNFYSILSLLAQVFSSQGQKNARV